MVRGRHLRERVKEREGRRVEERGGGVEGAGEREREREREKDVM